MANLHELAYLYFTYAMFWDAGYPIIQIAHRFLYRFSAATKAKIDHEYKIINTFKGISLFTRLGHAVTTTSESVRVSNTLGCIYS